MCRSLSGVRARDASATEHDLLVYEVQRLATSENMRDLTDIVAILKTTLVA